MAQLIAANPQLKFEAGNTVLRWDADKGALVDGAGTVVSNYDRVTVTSFGSGPFMGSRAVFETQADVVKRSEAVNTQNAAGGKPVPPSVGPTVPPTAPAAQQPGNQPAAPPGSQPPVAPNVKK